MRALVLHGHGGPENLVYDEAYPDPRVIDGHVVVRVRAASLNHHDVFTRRGMPGIELPLPVVLGLDMAGEVAEVGGGVEGWKAGDRVLVHSIHPQRGLVGEMLDGGLAERCLVSAQQLLRLPEGVGYEQAAALPVAYGTAHRMLFTNGAIRPGERLLVLGASGGVGTACVMLAKLAGCEVVVAASGEDKLRRLAGIGADWGIDSAGEPFERAIWQRYGKPHRRRRDGGVDVVVNFTGGDTWVPSLKVLRRGGRLLTCGATAGYAPAEDLRYLWTFELKVIGSNGWMREDLETLLRLVEARRLSPVIDRVLPLHQAAEGLSLLENRQVFGKVVVAP